MNTGISIQKEMLEEKAELEPERQKMRNAIANMLTAWGKVESSLLRLLGAVVIPLDGQLRFASAIFFSVDSLSARIDIVDSVVAELLMNTTDNFKLPIHEHWETIKGKLNRSKAIRHKVAHGQMTTIRLLSKGKLYVRLTPPIGEFEKTIECFGRKQLPGLCANDIEQSAIAAEGYAELIDAFTECARCLAVWRLEPLPEKLRRLADLLAQKQL
jgi:hypothetical protein